MDLEVEISHTKSANTCLICTCHRCRNIILIGGGGALTKQLGGLGQICFVNFDVRKLILVISGTLLSQEQYVYLVTGSHDPVTDASSQNIMSF